jgi:pyruvate formate lyase activating enzyme
MEPLRVGGLTPLTTLDYPGELAAVVFCQGCPWRCRYCHNGHLLPSSAPDQIPWEDLTAFLLRRRGLLDAVVFSGGEPTAQQALKVAMAEVRALGFKIGLHTAGCYPDRLESLLPLLDWVGLDIKGLPEDYPDITGVPGSGDGAWRSLEVLLASGVAYEVRTTAPPTWAADQLEALAERLAGMGVKRYALQTCITGRALDAQWRGMPSSGALSAATRARLEAGFTGFVVRGA